MVRVWMNIKWSALVGKEASRYAKSWSRATKGIGDNVSDCRQCASEWTIARPKLRAPLAALDCRGRCHGAGGLLGQGRS